MDGTLNRNSSPQAIAAFRDAYDGFLLKFPLLFGYWKKYADQEFNIAGPESAEMVSSRRLRPALDISLRRQRLDIANPIYLRSTSEAVLASPTRLTCGLSTAPSRWRRPTPQTSSESKCRRSFSFPPPIPWQTTVLVAINNTATTFPRFFAPVMVSLPASSTKSALARGLPNINPSMVSIQQKTYVGMRSHAGYQAPPSSTMIETCHTLAASSLFPLTLYPWICFVSCSVGFARCLH